MPLQFLWRLLVVARGWILTASFTRSPLCSVPARLGVVLFGSGAVLTLDRRRDSFKSSCLLRPDPGPIRSLSLAAGPAGPAHLGPAFCGHSPGRLPIARGRGPMPSAWEAGRIPSPAPSFWGCDTHCLLGWRLGSAPVAWRPGWWLAEAGGSPAAARVRARPASPGLIADGSALIIRDRGAWPRLRATGPRLGLVLVDRVGSTARVPAAGLQVLVGRPLCRWPLDSARDGPVRGQAGSLPG